jgi:diguanylate cyclase (GGDEF)-like protein
MLRRIVASVRPHYATIGALSVRDPALVLGSGLLICALCWSVGHPVVATVVALIIFANELIFHLLFRRIGPFGRLGKDKTLLFALALQSFNTLVFGVPAVLVAGDPSLAMKITGLMFVMGGQIYITNTWLRVPVFLFAMLVPAIGMLVLAFLNLTDSAPVASSALHWGIAFGVLIVFIYSSIDTLHQHVVTQNELFTAQKEASSRLAQLEESHRLDPLTGLLNRPAFDVALHVMLQDRALNGGDITVFLLDLDSFNPINDTYSHEAGDEVLIQTAGRLASFVGEAGIVGRLGGDEFICAVHDLEDTAEIMEFGTSLSKTVARKMHWKNRTFKIGASVGAASTQDGALGTVPALCSAADQAMFAAKSSPNDRPVIFEQHLFSPRMTAQDKQLLIDGIENQSVKPYYQPKIHLLTGQITGFEALARWEHDETNVRQPSEFLVQIGELGLQADFMISLAQQVVEDVSRFLKAGLDPGQVSLNVSEVALATHSGREDLKRILQENPKAAKHLTLEITEDVFIARAAETIQASIAAFRALGVRISLDDFGTGFASFHHLRQLDFDELTIDTSFVAGLGHDHTAEVLVRGFLDIASGLGVNVIAEGVETDAQSRELANMGCLTAQGYLFSPAIPLDLAIRQLKQQQQAA